MLRGISVSDGVMSGVSNAGVDLQPQSASDPARAPTSRGACLATGTHSGERSTTLAKGLGAIDLAQLLSPAIALRAGNASVHAEHGRLPYVRMAVAEFTRSCRGIHAHLPSLFLSSMRRCVDGSAWFR